MRNNIWIFSFLLFALAIPHCCIAQKKGSDSTVQNLVSNKQVLLTNFAVFKRSQSDLKGASAFLVTYKGQLYAVTAKHLLGEAGGVVPEVSTSELNKSLLIWKMFPRIPVDVESDTVKVNAELNYDHLENDILFLTVTNSDFTISPLSLSSEFPNKKAKYFIIGCPYEEPGCKQNIYHVEFKDVDLQTSTLICTIKSDVNLAGFSGAPIVDGNGLVVAVVVSGWEEGKKRYVLGTLINEIEKVRSLQK